MLPFTLRLVSLPNQNVSSHLHVIYPSHSPALTRLFSSLVDCRVDSLCSIIFPLAPVFISPSLSRPQHHSGHKGVTKNLSATRDRTRAIQPIAKHLPAWTTWPMPLFGMEINQSSCISAILKSITLLNTLNANIMPGVERLLLKSFYMAF